MRTKPTSRHAMRLKMSSTQDEGKLYFTPARFLVLLEREREWFEILMRVGLNPGVSPAYQVRICWSSDPGSCVIERRLWMR